MWPDFPAIPMPDAIVLIPAKLGGYGAIFASVPQEKLILAPPEGASLGSYSAYATLALGSALALFLYPHSMTGILSASDGNVVRRNAALLAAYSFILGLIALLGYMAIAAGVAALLVMLLTMLIVRRVTKPLTSVTASLTAIANGNADVEIDCEDRGA